MEQSATFNFGITDAAVLKTLGSYVQQTRINQRKTQLEVAIAAGVGRTTLINIENGKGGTLTSFIQILRALGTLSILEIFERRREISPLLLAEREYKYTKRIRHPNKSYAELEKEHKQKSKSSW
ncbi:MAG: transcriptional regulator [Bacteroidales bacterium]|jgi:transcriptional regulator with XRE-family HTH domain|nr:transcriptional regulator [Bacteroidales bacterium]